MPTHMAMAFIERVKNEINQRRIPTQSASGTNMMDATYNPLQTNEDFFFPQTADGRGSSVEILPGGQNLGEITDLKFFTNKLFRGLRIPASYLPTGIDDGTQAVSDGKVGTALIQEWRFNQYCKRLQGMVIDKLDQEFKMFMRWRGINIDSQLFELQFNEPQNFAQYRQADIDGAKIGTFTQLEQYPYFSKRFLMKRYLGLSEMEMSENEMMWAEEKGKGESADAGQANLRNVGITPGGLASDLESATPPPGADEAGGALDLGGEAGAPGQAAPPASPPGVM
jgi:Bacteriophage T4-like portal protein (Gp20)